MMIYKGWGVVAAKDILEGSFIVEYRGENRKYKDMIDDFIKYENRGLSYVFEYDFNGTKYWYV